MTTALSAPRLIQHRRWWVCALIVWAMVVAFSYQGALTAARTQAEAIAIEGARHMFRMVLLTRTWNAQHGGVYVPVTPEITPNPYLEHSERDLLTTSGKQLTMINPAYMTRLIAEISERDNGTRFRITSLNPVQPDNHPDDWESKALTEFSVGKKEVIGYAQDAQRAWLRFMAPLYVEEKCMSCHAQHGYEVGQVRGGISVSLPYDPVLAAIETQKTHVRLTHGILFCLVSLLGWGMLELLRRRWLQLSNILQELEESQRQVIQSEKMASVGLLAAGVAHEINNPVSYVRSNLGTLSDYSKTLTQLIGQARQGTMSTEDWSKADVDFLQEDMSDLIRESRQGLDRVQKIVADLKDFSHIDRAEWQETDINAGIESTLNVVWHQIKYKAEVVRDYGDIPMLYCIGSQINQVIMNLLVNAAQAIQDRGTISIQTRCTPQALTIRIRDTGCGMDEATLARIFEPFFTTKAVGQGTGLGLSLSRDIVRRHGGTLVANSSPGAGSEFVVTLPYGESRT